MPRILLTLTALLTAIVVAAGCGNDSSSSSGASALAPAGSLMYGEATLKPEGDQKAAIDALIEKFPGEGGAGERVRELMQKAFADSDSGLSYAKDVEPWLGDQAAFFLSGLSANGKTGDGALLVATEDEEQAFAALDKAIEGKLKSYKDTEYIADEGNAGAGVVDGWVVLGTEAGFKAAVDVAEGGRSMEGDEDFQRTLEDAPEERLGYVYVDLPGLAETIQRSPAGAAFGQLERFLNEPVVATMNADRFGVRFEAVVSKDFAGGFPVMAKGADLAGELPGDAWLALAQPDLGKTLSGYVDLFGAQLGGRENLEQQFRASTGLDLQEALSWMGDWGLFVRGTSVAELDGALMVETSDDAASGRLIDTVARLARRSADSGERVLPLQLSGGGEGVTFRSPDIPKPIHLFQRDGRVVMAYGDQAASDALAPGQKLAGTPAFAQAEEALGGDYSVAFYLAVAPILELVDSTGAGANAEWAEARSYLEPLGALVSGAKEDGDKLRSVVGITVD